MNQPNWLSVDQILILHDIQIKRFGGASARSGELDRQTVARLVAPLDYTR